MNTRELYIRATIANIDISDADSVGADVLEGKTFYAGEVPKKTGTMPNIGDASTDISTKEQVVTIQEGYHNGFGEVKISDTEQAKIIASNIVNGVDILGVTGTASSGPSIPSEGLETFGGSLNGSLNFTSPTNYDPSNDWDMVALGNDHGLGIKNGALYSWGNNLNGRTGLNITTSTITFEPTQVGVENDWYMISAGDQHSYGIRKSGANYTLWVWGVNTSGQLGLGDTTLRSVPTQVGSDTDWTWISGGQTWGCAIKGGRLFTCGINSSARTGQNIGTGTTITWTNYDSGSTGWEKCFAGVIHGIGVRSGELWSWGSNSTGRTGQGTVSGSTLIPTNTSTGSIWSHGSAGNLHSMMIKTDGTLWAFGAQLNGRLGNGLTTNVNISTPTQIVSDTDWESVKANGNSSSPPFNEFSYAIKGGRLYATGINNLGQLGLAPSANVATFTEIGNGANYIDLASGSGFGMAIRKNP
jgi:alpha-tubulin suppressor-like RCC1 family protein